MPLLISTAVMFQAQNREIINSTWKVAVSFKIIMKTSVIRLFHNTIPDLQDQDQDHSLQDQDQYQDQDQDQDQDEDHSVQDQDHSVKDQDQDRFFLVSYRSCLKTNGLRPHHWLQWIPICCIIVQYISHKSQILILEING